MAGQQEIAIIGLGCRFAGEVNTPSKLWELLKDPRSLSRPVPFLKGHYHENPKQHGHTNVQAAYLLSDDEQDKQKFDASFFNIGHAEASAMDPQLRMSLEIVYEALEDAGIAMEKLRGSDTAVYTGTMVSDYEMVMNRDYEVMPSYQVSGTTRTMLSSRISYFYDWQGPSMTIDTACSSSLTALHQAVQQLRSGHSRVAVVAAANLIMDPIPFIGMSNLTMLSPQGTCRMWDAEANGYGRGEGVAAIVLKTRAAAEADGDLIDCVIRETALNQDGRSLGPTTPSPSAQARLIRDCYARAGLDLSKPADRPQYFEAHGTGTPAGDPVEAEAISTALFPDNNKDGHGELLVGSIKTVVGHTEATAGLAALLKVTLALKHGVVPPNLHFNSLNPKLTQFYNNKLRIPTKACPWPKLLEQSTRRVSINSFGLGGANAHVILETYDTAQHQPAPSSSSSASKENETLLSPFVFSSSTEESLRSYLSSFLDYVRTNASTLDLRDICYTLHSRRSLLPVTTTISASSLDELCCELERKIAGDTSGSADSSPRIGLRAPRPVQTGKPKILGVFTGQGAQWPRMGVELLQSSPAARSILQKLQNALDGLPEASRPHWTLLHELQKDPSSSCVMSAAFSQPLCTALQIIQIDLLRAAGIEFAAVVGHSSGEIAAAYASGFLDACDAICIAYYRGFCASPVLTDESKIGSMIAVGTSHEDAQHLLSFPEFQGRASIAATNSMGSITISGDDDAINELIVVFKDEEKFVRKLQVDLAYHSRHMKIFSDPYSQALTQLNVKVGSGNQTVWFSSVTESSDKVFGSLADSLSNTYWINNMVQPVMFMPALQNAIKSVGALDLVIELGPHPALKGPVLDIIQAEIDLPIPYTGLLRRGQSATFAFAEGIGYAWSYLEKGTVDLGHLDRFASNNNGANLVKDLPSHSWDHQDMYWHESRRAQIDRKRPSPAHMLLGSLTPDSTRTNMQWRHTLRISELPWLKNHCLQNIPVLPATGYIISVLEAAMVFSEDENVSLIQILDTEFNSATVFEREASDVEILLTVSNITRLGNEIHALFHYYAGSGEISDVPLELKVHGSVRLILKETGASYFPPRAPRDPNLVPVRAEKFYESLARLEYGYTGQFRGLTNLERRLGVSRGNITKKEESSLLIHPGVLDACYQSAFLASCHPDDGSFRSMFIPRRVKKLVVNLDRCTTEMTKDADFEFDAVQDLKLSQQSVTFDIDLYAGQDDNGIMVQTQGLELVPISQPTEKDDVQAFSTVVWGKLDPPLTPRNDQDMQNFVGEVVDTLAHRGAYLRVLEICNNKESSASTKILKMPRSKILSLTIAVTEDLDSQDDKADGLATYDTAKIPTPKHGLLQSSLDFNKDLEEQGYDQNSFDLVILPLSGSVDRLNKMRQVVKDDGYILVTHVDIGSEAAVSEFIDTIRLSGLIEPTTETLISCSTLSSPVSLLLATAETVSSSLRLDEGRPSSTSQEMHIASLLILHGLDQTQFKLASQLSDGLSAFCSSVTTVSSLPDIRKTDVVLRDTVVLSIIDAQPESIFQDIDEQSWAGVKMLVEDAKAIFWVTQGRRYHNPYANMILGLLRCAVRENMALEYLSFDVELPSQVSNQNILSAFLRFYYVPSRAVKNGEFEREIVLNKDNQLTIPRIMMDGRMNSRFNSGSRKVTSSVQSDEHNILLVPDDTGFSLELGAPYTSLGSASQQALLHTMYSHPTAIQITPTSRLFLSIGTNDLGSGQRSIALCSSHRSQILTPTRLVIANRSPSLAALPATAILTKVANALVASSIVRQVASGGRALIHEPSDQLATVISAEARSMGVEIIFTTYRSDHKSVVDATSKWVFVHPQANGQTLTRITRRGFTTFVNLSTRGTDHVAESLAQKLPPSCRRYQYSDFMGESGWQDSFDDFAVSQIETRLVEAVTIASKTPDDDLTVGGTVSLNDLTKPGFQIESTSQVIDWKNDSQVTVTTRPVESLVSFNGDKTYWMIGLAGGLGLSLCEWMADRGARSFAISSRNPKLETSWLQEMKERGVAIHIVPCDITQKNSLQEAFDKLRATAAPIAGVIQGAMVLRDTAIQNMSLKTFLEVTAPKVQGTMFLNSLFQDDTLDLFICLSSVVSILGNIGQANYAAANGFMASVVEQRRRKGLAASILHMGPVFGVGYITKVTEDSIMSEVDLQRGGCCRTSEKQFHQLFGEAVLNSYSRAETSKEIISGLEAVGAHSSKMPPWKAWKLMTHLASFQQEIQKTSGEAKRKKTLREQLFSVDQSTKQTYDIVWGSFTASLASTFHIKVDRYSKAELGDMRFDQIGIDSLTAVEIRGWFNENLGVNIPILKILNGASIGQLVAFALEQTSSSPDPTAADDVDRSESSSATQSEGEGADSDTQSQETTVTGSSAGLPDVLKSYPVSFTQGRFYMGSNLLAQDLVSLNHTTYGRFNGSIDPKRLRNALRAITKKHEILRTAFFDVEGQQMQHILAESCISLEQRQIETAQQVQDLAMDMQQNHVYRVDLGETIRLLLLSSESGESYFILGLHPLVLDATSFIAFCKLLGHYYENPNSNRHVKHLWEVSQIQHAAYRSGKFQTALDYWKQEFSTPPPPLPVMTVAQVEQRPQLKVYENIRAHCVFDQKTRTQVNQVCQQMRVTPFHFYLTVLRVLLLYYTANGEAEDVTIAVAESGRGENQEDMEVLGPLYNLILLRLMCARTTSFQDLLQTVRDKTYAGLANSSIPYPVLLQELELQAKAKDNPFFQVFIDYRMSQKSAMAFSEHIELQVEGFELNVPYDVYLDIIDLEGQHHFFLRQDMFDRQAADGIAKTYEQLVTAFANEPTIPVTVASLVKGMDN